MIRNMQENEYHLLGHYLLLACYLPPNSSEKITPNLLKEDSKLIATLQAFGTQEGDYAYVAQLDDRVVGACWTRLAKIYGYVDDSTPVISIALDEKARGKGLGTKLLEAVCDKLRQQGYFRCSLSVHKENPARYLYHKLGFHTINYDNQESEWIMVKEL